MKNAYPQKDDVEIEVLVKKFYHHYCNTLIETIKILNISEEQLKQRVTFENLDLYKKYHSEGKSVFVMMGHLGNWEVAGARMAIEEDLYQLFVYYQPLKNKRWDQLMYNLRTRFGSRLYTKKGILRGMTANRDLLTANVFLSDQTPPEKGAYWTSFLQQETAFYVDVEKLAQKFNYPVIYASVKKATKGNYTIRFETLCDNPKDEKEFCITENYVRLLEKDILEQPESWLWLRNRWDISKEN